MGLSYTDEQIRAKAAELGLVQPGEALPRHLRSRVVAALAATDLPRPAEAAPMARSITITPDRIEIDGRPIPWLVQADRIEVAVEPDGSGMVRLTIPAGRVQIINPERE